MQVSAHAVTAPYTVRIGTSLTLSDPTGQATSVRTSGQPLYGSRVRIQYEEGGGFVQGTSLTIVGAVLLCPCAASLVLLAVSAVCG